MRRNSRSGGYTLTLVALTAVVSLSGRVEAQQTGLFPLAPIRRQRVPCDREDPTYKVYKQQYFGYHPTCWRTFPAGWGCPSTEGPNREKSFKDFPLGQARDDEGNETGAPDGRGAPPEGRAPAVPDLPRDRDPFVTDEPGGAMPGANPLPRGNNPPRGANPPAGDRPDPFAPNPGRGASNSPSRNRSRAGIAPAGPVEDTPELTAPAAQPAQGSVSRSGRGQADDDVVAGGDDGPLLGLADADIVRADDADAASDAPTSVSMAPTPGAPAGSNATTPAQPRRRLFGNLFSSLGANWTRR